MKKKFNFVLTKVKNNIFMWSVSMYRVYKEGYGTGSVLNDSLSTRAAKDINR